MALVIKQQEPNVCTYHLGCVGFMDDQQAKCLLGTFHKDAVYLKRMSNKKQAIIQHCTPIENLV